MIALVTASEDAKAHNVNPHLFEDDELWSIGLSLGSAPG